MKHQSVFSWFSVFILAMALSFSGCKGDMGDTGPSGPAGPKGDQGIKGDQGNPGNYNVKSFTFDISSWTAQGTPGSLGYQVVNTLNIPSLTANIVNGGLVMVYFQYTDDPIWYPLPYTYPNGNYTEVIDYWALVGQVILRVRATDFAAAQPTGKARVIIATADGLAEVGELDWADYHMVAEEFGLEP